MHSTHLFFFALKASILLLKGLLVVVPSLLLVLQIVQVARLMLLSVARFLLLSVVRLLLLSVVRLLLLSIIRLLLLSIIGLSLLLFMMLMMLLTRWDLAGHQNTSQVFTVSFPHHGRLGNCFLHSDA